MTTPAPPPPLSLPAQPAGDIPDTFHTPPPSARLHNLLVTYPDTFNRAIRPRQMAVTEDSRVLFHPSGSMVQVGGGGGKGGDVDSVDPARPLVLPCACRCWRWLAVRFCRS